MGTPLPVPSLDFEGLTKAETIKYKNSSVHNTEISRETSMVLCSQFTSYSKSNLEGKTPAESSRQNGESTETYHTSCMEVLKVANTFLLPDCDPQTIELITGTVRQSSESNYQRKWQIFLKFTESRGIAFNDIEKGVVINFLSHLFYAKGLSLSDHLWYRTIGQLSRGR